MTGRTPPVNTRPSAQRIGRAVRRFRVTVTEGPSTGTTWTNTAERCAIGSHPSNDLVIEDSTVSRFHCELAIAGSAVRVRDLGSRNGTLLGLVQLTDAMVPGRTTLVLGNSEVRIDVADEHTQLAASERASFGGVPVPASVLQQVVTHYSRSPELPDGVDLQKPFSLPASIRAVETRPGAATIVQ